MVAIGRNAAGAVLGGRAHVGFPAWLLWLGVHLYKLIGFRNRLVVRINWIWDYSVHKRAARVLFPSNPEVLLRSSPRREPGAGGKPSGTGGSGGPPETGETMTVTWTRDPASTEGPASLEATYLGATLTVAERGSHWFASVIHPDGTRWSQACRTEDEAKTLALRAAEARKPAE